MFTLEKLQELARRYPTPIRNVEREYIQHLFVQALSKLDRSGVIGTCSVRQGIRWSRRPGHTFIWCRFIPLSMATAKPHGG